MPAFALDTEPAIIEFTLHGRAFHVDVFVEMDALVELDAPFQDRKDEDGNLSVADSNAWLDAVARRLVEVHGAPYCSRHGAFEFYGRVLAVHRSLKKTLSWTLPSDTGSASTPAPSPTGANAPGSNTSPDSTPNGDSPATI